jgi:hypothetical protein
MTITKQEMLDGADEWNDWRTFLEGQPEGRYTREAAATALRTEGFMS